MILYTKYLVKSLPVSKNILVRQVEDFSNVLKITMVEINIHKHAVEFNHKEVDLQEIEILGSNYGNKFRRKIAEALFIRECKHQPLTFKRNQFLLNYLINWIFWDFNYIWFYL